MKNKSLALLFGGILLAGCANDEFNIDKPLTTDGIAFGIITSGTVGTTRSGAAAVTDTITLNSDNGNMTLDVFVKEGEWLTESKAATRSTPTTTENLNQFRVNAYFYDTEATEDAKLFFEETATYNATADVWQTGKTYYWPANEENKLAFLGYSPVDLFENTENGVQYNGTSGTKPTNENDFKISYVANADSKLQPDIMAYTTEKLNNHSKTEYTAVPMKFKHILSQVRVCIGSEMQNGTIKSVTFTNITKGGTFSEDEWTLSSDLQDYTITVNQEVTTGTPEKTPVGKLEETFMMVPQTLAEDAKISVEFIDINGKLRTLEAEIGGNTWLMGQSKTYYINVSPFYELKFDEETKIADAHYEIVRTKIMTKNLGATDNWELTAEASDGAKVTLLRATEANKYQLDGYWVEKMIDETDGNLEIPLRGDVKINGSYNTSEPAAETFEEYLLFLPENTGTENRTITLKLMAYTLLPNGDKDYDETSKREQTVIQYCPTWNGNAGWEVIDDNQFGTWGQFSGGSVKYKNNINMTGGSGYNKKAVEAKLKDIISDYGLSLQIQNDPNTPYNGTSDIFMQETNDGEKVWNIELYFLNGKDSANENSSSPDDGYANTKALLNLEKGGGMSSFQSLLESITTDNGTKMFTAVVEGDNTEVVKSGALEYIRKKNRYTIIKKNETIGGATTIEVLTPGELEWYLPAVGQFTDTKGFVIVEDCTFPEWTDKGTDSAKDMFWSSTSAEDNQAYNGMHEGKPRTSTLKVRAARNKLAQ